MKLYVTPDEFLEIKRLEREIQMNPEHMGETDIRFYRGVCNILMTTLEPFQEYELVVVKELKQSMFFGYDRFNQPQEVMYDQA